MDFELFSPGRAPDKVTPESYRDRVERWNLGESVVTVTTYPGGIVSEEWWLGDPRNGILHREGAPAKIVWSDGRVTQVIYAVRGSSSRLGGPAVAFFDRYGSVSSQAYAFEGPSTPSVTDWARVLGKVEPQVLLAGLRAAGFGELLDRGHSVAEIVEIFGRGVLAPAGVSAVLDGAPADWVRSFEAGAASG